MTLTIAKASDTWAVYTPDGFLSLERPSVQEMATKAFTYATIFGQCEVREVTVPWPAWADMGETWPDTLAELEAYL